MSESLDIFRAHAKRSQTLVGIGDYLKNSVTFDVSDIYRAVIVLIVSALDSYVHEVVIEKLPGVINDETRQTDALLRFSVPVKWVKMAQTDPNKEAWAIGAVREGHGYLSFQQPDNIADALRLISSKSIWPEVAALLGKEVVTIKQEIKLVIDRRNKIAHEADMNPTIRELWPIDAASVTDAVALICNIVEALDLVVE